MVSLKTFAQDLPTSTVLGNNPLKIKWRYIDTKAVKVIFPAGNEKEGLRVANAINLISDSLGVTVGTKRKHLDLLIQTNQVISNGYVGLAPFRSEFYATSFQSFNYLGSITWLDALTFHEYRHALQMANTRNGLTKFGYWIGGQSMWQLLQLIAIPNWYLEGDAVQTETVLSAAGRGRTPSFFQEQKALLFNNRNYRYIKARNGSFKDLMPNHYPLGYAMLHQVRGEFGPEVWAKVLKDGSSYRSVFYPFARALKRHTGYTTRRMYKHTYDELKKNWEEDLKNVELIPTTHVTATHKTVTDYTWAQQQEDGSIVCIKSSYKKIPHLTLIKDGKEKSLTAIGIVTENFLSGNNKRFAWVEMSTDLRRQNRNYNNIVTYDLATHKKRRITSKTKLYSPQFSVKGDKIVAVKANDHIRTCIVFINPADGSQTDTIANPDNDFIAYPKWSENDESIIYIAKRNSLVAILKYDLTSKSTTELTPWSHHVIEGTSIGKDQVYYTASYSGINNVYASNLSGDKVVRQISSVKIGANMPNISPDNKTLLMSEYNYKGQELTKQEITPETGKAIELVAPADQATYRILTTSVEKNMVDHVPNNAYEIKDYKGIIRGAKLHTWGITSDLSSFGGSIRIDNILNDFGLSLKAAYNRNEQTVNFTGSVDYSALFLPISIYGAANNRFTKVYTGPGNIPDDTTNALKFREVIAGGNISLPMSWINGPYSTALKLIAGASQIITSGYEYGTGDNKVSVDTSLSNTVFQGGLLFSNIRKKAYQNVLPRFGQIITANINQSVNNNSVLKYMATAALYFPGLFANHSLLFTGSWRQEELSNTYRFLDNFNHARGYTPILGDEEYVASVNYQLPLFYPDFGFGGIAYLKRLRLNGFCDISQVNRYATNQVYSQNSAGFEILFDVVFANLIPMSVGLRESFLIDKDYFDKTKENMFQFYLAGTF